MCPLQRRRVLPMILIPVTSDQIHPHLACQILEKIVNDRLVCLFLRLKQNLANKSRRTDKIACWLTFDIPRLFSILTSSQSSPGSNPPIGTCVNCYVTCSQAHLVSYSLEYPENRCSKAAICEQARRMGRGKVTGKVTI